MLLADCKVPLSLTDSKKQAYGVLSRLEQPKRILTASLESYWVVTKLDKDAWDLKNFDEIFTNPDQSLRATMSDSESLGWFWATLKLPHGFALHDSEWVGRLGRDIQ